MKSTKSTKSTQPQADELTAKAIAFEPALLAAVKAGVLAGKAIDSAIAKAGLAYSDEEHAACKPVSAADKAKAELLAFGIDADALAADTSKADTLAVTLDTLARAVGKYGRHAVICDNTNGTSLATHYMLNTLATAGRVTLADTLKAVRAHLPNYASAGHYNTIKAMLRKAGFTVNVSQGSFSVKA